LATAIRLATYAKLALSDHIASGKSEAAPPRARDEQELRRLHLGLSRYQM